jgi:uncharacterized phage protein (TIGR01671 family)
MASIRSRIGENMEDIYLYKAKTTPKEKGEFNNVWVTGNLIVSNGKYYIHPVGNVVNVRNEIGRIIVMHEVIPETICQCTGLKDDNGTPIFENDVLSLTDKVNYYEWKAVIKFGNPNAEYAWGWWLIPLTKCDANKDILLWIETELNTIECRVIGNIFDNKELLESEE